MSALTISLIVCGLLIGGALTGALLRRVLPDHHLDSHAKDIVRLGCALIATISGLVLGLLINSAKTTYDASATRSGSWRPASPCSTTCWSFTERSPGRPGSSCARRSRP